MKLSAKTILIGFIAATLCLTACRKNEPRQQEEDTPVTPPSTGSDYVGFYLLNEGNMGSNKASLDYFDFASGVYSRNIFGERNPHVTMELGDVGNDLKIYGKKMYAVINCSNLVEVMNAGDATHITQITIPNCRYITFYNGKAYVSSYAGKVEFGTKQIGYIAEIDTTTLTITRKCNVGFQPDELAAVDGKLYVANSGGYLAPDYDNTLSVVDLASFTETKKITLKRNMHRVRVSSDKKLYITSRGNYNDELSDIFVFDPSTESIVKDFNLPASNLAISGDSCYLYSWQYNMSTESEDIAYHIINTKSMEVVDNNLIKDGTDARIKVPYSIAVNNQTREFIVCDASDYVSPGTLYYFNKDGSLKWSTTTGDIPSSVAFINK